MDIRELAREEYPPSLREIPDAPGTLWMRGTLAPSHTHLAVVGSRALTDYGRDACHYLIAGLAGYPVTIVSGLALGADAAAHRAALASGLHTIAVPGSGLADSVLAPRAHVSLAHEILASGGALLSEHPSTHVARPYDFAARNRIMVGMADAVLLIEGGAKSGTLISARLAAEYNRELLCVPHRINDPNGFGSHLFLRLGATLVTDPLHILEALGLRPDESRDRPRPHLSEPERVLYELLATPQARETVIKHATVPREEALIALVTLELKGLAREEYGRWRRIR